MGLRFREKWCILHIVKDCVGIERKVRQMSATIKDIAEKCGLSEIVVGRVLRDYSEIGEAVRDRVRDAARELGYPLNAAVNEGRTHNLGMMMADESDTGLTHPFFAAMVNAFRAEAELHGYDLTFINHNIGKQGATYLQHCLNRHFDGVCLACVDFYSDQVKELLDSDIPCVTVDHPCAKHPTVMSDNREGLELLVNYAVSLGHERIAFISGQRNSEVTETRRNVYLSTMKAHDLPVPEGYLLEGVYSDTNVVREMVTGLLRRVDRPTCILLPDDATYFGAQEAVRDLELRVPSDISLAGYDGIPLTQTLRPQLTTIRQKNEEMGKRAALCLIERLEHPERPVPSIISVPVELIKGSTIGWCNEW